MLRETLHASVVQAAPRLLGCCLVRGDRRAMIVEVEAYRGIDDPGSHSWRGKTPRTEIMHGPPGLAYVYFTYGMHWMLNVVAEGDGQPGAVLIRAAKPVAGIEEMRARRQKARSDHDLLSGPAKLCAAFDIARAENGIDLLDPRSELRIEPGEPVGEVLYGTRIGLSQGRGEHYPWRFVHARELAWASEPKKDLRPLRPDDWTEILSFAGLSAPTVP